MSEPENHFDLGSGWPLRKDEPGDNRGVSRSPWFRGALLAVFGLLVIAIAIGVRLSMGPPVFAPAESPPPQLLDAPTVKSMPEEELTKIAIAEVKKREGWSGKAVGPYPGEGSECTVGVERDPDNPPSPTVDVFLDRFTGAVVDYRKDEPNAVEAAKAWRELLHAMAARDEKRMRQLTTHAGFESLKKAAKGEDQMQAFERWGKGWQKWGTRWQHFDAPDHIECHLGSDIKGHLLVFKKTAEGWKLDEWYPGE